LSAVLKNSCFKKTRDAVLKPEKTAVFKTPKTAKETLPTTKWMKNAIKTLGAECHRRCLANSVSTLRVIGF